jgi:mono/diheme cytochrome c family protein
MLPHPCRTRLGLSLIFTAATAFPATNPEIFRDRIAPAFAKHCASCHSGAAPAGGLTLGSLDALLTGGKHGAAITPGDAAGSLVIRQLRGDAAPKMPLGGSIPEAAISDLSAAINAMQPTPKIASKQNAYTDWLLHKPARPTVPGKTANAVDAFIFQKLEAQGLKQAPPADRRTLIRRVHFDLLGVPPSPEDVQAFVTDPAPDAYPKLVDKLLADPRYGERWARHWLDLVRFAESDGFAIDGERPTAWRYRDYVIRAFNRDKPYDQFIREQLAGDEMEGKDVKPAGKTERLIAMGYMRMGTWEADANFKTQLRQDFLNDITTTTSQVFLGLTAGCARCHDHKYDPIPQRDFYRLQAFFAASKPDERPAPHLDSEDPKRMKALAREYEDGMEEAAARFKKVDQEYRQKYVQAKGLKPADTAAADYKKALKDPRDPVYTGDERKAYDAARDEERRLSDARPRYLATAYSVSDVVPPQVPAVADTFVLAGGELANKNEKVEPGFLQCITGKPDPAKIPFAGGSAGRRIALADWIASSDNPMTARVMVNRVWQHLFGEGMVRTPSDWGLNGDRPSHPELIDWLATEFVEKKWSIKALQRTILTSNTYQQAAESPDFAANTVKDPDNRLLWRMNWKRLEAESLRDSILTVSGRLRQSGGGPGVFLDIPPDVAEGFEFFKWFPSDQKDQLRRSIYTFQRRSVMMPMVEVFDGANMNESCSRRSVTTVPTQAFSLLNSAFTNREAQQLADRVIELAGTDRNRQIEKAFQLALDRTPAPEERARAIEVLGNLPPREALTRLGVVLFNLNEFVYVN